MISKKCFWLAIFLIFYSSSSNSQTVINEVVPIPLNSDCTDCQLNNLYMNHGKLQFTGGSMDCRDYELIFSDDFDGTTLDESKWATCFSYDGVFCNSRVHGNSGAFFKDENVIVRDGFCKLTTKKEHTTFPEVCFQNGICWTSRKFTSGMLFSKQKFFNFSRYEIRCKIPNANKMWPSFWVFGWSTEIDVFEFVEQGPTNPEFSLHKWFQDGSKYSTASGAIPQTDLSLDFHTYAVETDKFFVRWYIDDILVYSKCHFKSISGYDPNNLSTISGIYPREMAFPECNVPLNVIASNGCGPNISANESGYPNDMVIDYIRVYKSNNDPNSGCNYSISGPAYICNRKDTVEYCITGGDAESSSFKLPAGVQVIQNPSYELIKKIITIGPKDTLIIDTIFKKNCIKVKFTEAYNGEPISFDVPVECQFLNGPTIKKVVDDNHIPNYSYTLSSDCKTIRICVENLETFDFIQVTNLDDLSTEYFYSNCIELPITKFTKYGLAEYSLVFESSKCGRFDKVISVRNILCDK